MPAKRRNANKVNLLSQLTCSPVRHESFLLACDGINAESFHRRLKLRPRLFIILDVMQIPLPYYHRLLPLPQLEESRCPEAHENGEEHRGRVVKEIRDLSEQARVV